jgi:hypothetical protein
MKNFKITQSQSLSQADSHSHSPMQHKAAGQALTTPPPSAGKRVNEASYSNCQEQNCIAFDSLFIYD